MSNELTNQEVLDAIRRLEEAHANRPDPIGASKKYFGWVQALIGIVAVVLSLGVSWGITTSKMSAMEANLLSQKGRIAKLENDVHTLQLSQARDDLLFKNIDEKLSELKVDVKKLIRGED